MTTSTRAVRSTSKSPYVAPDIPPSRVALIGFGLAGAVFHAPLIETTPGLRLTTIVTGDPERADRARREYPEAAIEAETEAVWARADEHELVVIAAPNSAHVPLARRAIDAGLALVVDKPLAPSSVEARELTERAAAAGVPLTVFQNRRWDSDFLTLRQLVDSGELGEIQRFESRFERWRPELQDSAWRESASRAEGGGLLLDLGTHLVDQAIVLFGPVAEVYGEADHRRGGRPTTTSSSRCGTSPAFAATSGPRRSPPRSGRDCACSGAAGPSSSTSRTGRRRLSHPGGGRATRAGERSRRNAGAGWSWATRRISYDPRTATGRSSIGASARRCMDAGSSRWIR